MIHIFFHFISSQFNTDVIIIVWDNRGVIISNGISLAIAKQVVQFQNPVLRVCFLVPSVVDVVPQKADPKMEITVQVIY